MINNMTAENQNPKDSLVAYVLVTFLVLFLIIVAFSFEGCTYSIPKNIAKIEQKNAGYLPQYCANRFPIKESVKDSIIYLKGDIEYRFDTVSFNVDSFISAIKNNGSLGLTPKVIKLPCPPCPISADTLLHYQKTTEESTADLTAVQLLLDAQKDSTITQRNNAANWQKKHKANLPYVYGFWGIIVAVLLFIILRVWRSFNLPIKI